MNQNQISQPLSKSQLISIHQLVDEVGKRQLQDFGQINSDIKPDGTLITECDRWSDKKIVQGLSQIAPGEGVLSEEGKKSIPSSSEYWVVDPLDGTTNFAAGIPYWAISIARFMDGEPETAFLDIPALKKRIFAIRGKGVWLNDKPLSPQSRFKKNSDCISLCSRSIKVLQMKPEQSFPGKIRLLGVSSLNMTSVAIGQTIAALEATPKIWDIAAAWLILEELNCLINWLDINPKDIRSGTDLTSVNFPLLTASSEDQLNNMLPWATALIQDG
jgi:myo-inositol-1(or 4)-monophosphatase